MNTYILLFVFYYWIQIQSIVQDTSLQFEWLTYHTKPKGRTMEKLKANTLILVPKL